MKGQTGRWSACFFIGRTIFKRKQSENRCSWKRNNNEQKNNGPWCRRQNHRRCILSGSMIVIRWSSVFLRISMEQTASRRRRYMSSVLKWKTNWEAPEWVTWKSNTRTNVSRQLWQKKFSSKQTWAEKEEKKSSTSRLLFWSSRVIWTHIQKISDLFVSGSESIKRRGAKGNIRKDK